MYSAKADPQLKQNSAEAAKGETRDELALRRGYGGDWPAIRDAFLAEHRECARCRQPATVAHHLQEVSRGGSHEHSNLLPLCESCHGWVHRKDPEAPRRYGLNVYST